MLSISGHKMHAPKGVAALYVKKGTRFTPYMIGGHQEGARRSGTENVASVIGFGKASELAREHLSSDNGRLKGLRDRLEKGLLETCPGARVNGDTDNRQLLDIQGEFCCSLDSVSMK